MSKSPIEQLAEAKVAKQRQISHIFLKLLDTTIEALMELDRGLDADLARKIAICNHEMPLTRLHDLLDKALCVEPEPVKE